MSHKFTRVQDSTFVKGFFVAYQTFFFSCSYMFILPNTAAAGRAAGEGWGRVKEEVQSGHKQVFAGLPDPAGGDPAHHLHPQPFLQHPGSPAPQPGTPSLLQAWVPSGALLPQQRTGACASPPPPRLPQQRLGLPPQRIVGMVARRYE